MNKNTIRNFQDNTHLRAVWGKVKMFLLVVAGDSTRGSAAKIEAALPFYFLLTLLSHSWILYYLPVENDPGALPSFFLQHVIIFTSALYLDARIPGRLRYFLAGALLTYTIQMHMSALGLSITGSNITEAWIISTRCNNWDDFIFMINEAGFTLKAFIGIIIILANIFVIGCVIRYFFFIITFQRRRFMIIVPVIFCTSIALFIVEQSWSREYPEYFTRRQLPYYIELFRHNRFTHVIPLRKELSENRIREILSRMGRPRRRANILFIVLESFRHDMIDKTICPNLFALGNDSLTFSRSYCDGIHTTLSWNVIFMGRPTYSFGKDLRESGGVQKGSIVMRILKRAGYSTHLIASANFHWNGYYHRISGDDGVLDSHYFSYEEFPGKPRNVLDDKTTARSIELIDSLKNKPDPFALFVQLDSSHFTYFFDDDSVLFKKYPQKVGFYDIKRKEKISYLFNRYKNAAHHVDNKIGMLLSALKKNGLYDDTIIVVVSDHGEGFAPGKIGHHVFYNEIMKLLLLVRLPGIPARNLDNPVSQRDIMPGIIDYLSIPGNNPALLPGKSFLKSGKGTPPIFTLQGSVRIAELNFYDAGILFRTDIDDDSITLTPYGMIDGECKNIDIMQNMARFPWKKLSDEAIK